MYTEREVCTVKYRTDISRYRPNLFVLPRPFLNLNDFDSCSVFTRSLIVKGLTLSCAVRINEVSKC